MRSDWDDAPDYLRNRKKPSPWRFLAILGIGTAVLSALAFTFGKPIVLDINQIKAGIHIGGKPLFSQEPAQPISRPAVANHPAPAAERPPVVQPQRLSKEDMEWLERRAEETIKSRQTSFNDDNYRPKQPANTYSPPAQQFAAPHVSNERKSRSVNRERSAKWIKSWNGGTNYLAEWLSVNNYIDGTSVCANHRRGSIDYRECRKAAKQHFHEECRSWRARFDNDRKDLSERMRTRYCGAASSFNPMG